MHPTSLTIPVFHAPPVSVLGGDPQRHVAALEHPVDAVGQRRSAAYVTFRGLHGYVSRQRQAGDRALSCDFFLRGQGDR